MINGEETQIFNNRREAGRVLADKLVEYKGRTDAVVIGLPRGGVPVAAEVALRLNLPLDTLVVRKLAAPINPEFGFGAIAPGDVLIIEQGSLQSLGLSTDSLEQILTSEREEMERRMDRYGSGAFAIDGPYEVVIVVDDGLATGVSATAALESARLIYKPKELVLAVPVCSRQAVTALESRVSKLICLSTPASFGSVGEWYLDFKQLEDHEVSEYLRIANHRI